MHVVAVAQVQRLIVMVVHLLGLVRLLLELLVALELLIAVVVVVGPMAITLVRDLVETVVQELCI